MITIRISQKAKDQLIKLKRQTGIQNWNVLCRWAFCISMAEPTIPQCLSIHSYSNVEMDWRTFAGEYAEVYWAILLQRCHDDGLPLDQRNLSLQLRQHINRGIGYMATPDNFKDIYTLFNC